MIPADVLGVEESKRVTGTRMLRSRATKYEILVRRERIKKELNARRQKQKLRRQQRKLERLQEPSAGAEPVDEAEQRQELIMVQQRQQLLEIQHEVARRMRPFIANLMRRPQPLTSFQMDMTDTPARMEDDTLVSALQIFAALERKLGQDEKLMHAMIHYMYQLCLRNGLGTTVQNFIEYLTNNVKECVRKYNINAVRVFEVEINRPDGQGGTRTDYCYSKIWAKNFPPPGCRGFKVVVDNED